MTHATAADDDDTAATAAAGAATSSMGAPAVASASGVAEVPKVSRARGTRRMTTDLPWRAVTRSHVGRPGCTRGAGPGPWLRAAARLLLATQRVGAAVWGRVVLWVATHGKSR